MSHVTWCFDSGESVQKSHCMSWSRRPLRARRFCDRMKFWNFMGSRMKKTGVLLPTMSQLPSRVYSFSENPRGSRQVSGLPRSPATVENRMMPSVTSPGWNTAALVKRLRSWVTSNRPKAPLPLACGWRSGMRSRLKFAICSIR